MAELDKWDVPDRVKGLEDRAENLVDRLETKADRPVLAGKTED